MGSHNGSKRGQRAKKVVDELQTNMRNRILAQIRDQVLVFDQAHALVEYCNPDTSRAISHHIQALWRAITDVEQAIALYGIDVETFEQRCAYKSATSSLSTRPSIAAYKYHSFIRL
jgi:hypothetical protein